MYSLGLGLTYSNSKCFLSVQLHSFHEKRPWTGCRKWMETTAAYKKNKKFSHCWILIENVWVLIDTRCVGWCLNLLFEEWSVLSVSIIETKMCLDVVFGSCCSPGMTVDAHIKHEVNFFFSFLQGQEDSSLSLPHLDAVHFNAPSPQCHSNEERGCSSLF